MRPPEFIATMTMMAFGFALVLPMVRAWARRIEAKDKVQALSPGANDPRLERMEQAIDAIAIEVERIAEAHRFQTRLLSVRAKERVLSAGDPMRRSEI